jgi:hypothetical protein
MCGIRATLIVTAVIAANAPSQASAAQIGLQCVNNGGGQHVLFIDTEQRTMQIYLDAELGPNETWQEAGNVVWEFCAWTV